MHKACMANADLWMKSHCHDFYSQVIFEVQAIQHEHVRNKVTDAVTPFDFFHIAVEIEIVWRRVAGQFREQGDH